MELNRTLDQHIAVFGESGSGKTVLLSSFYGAAKEPGWSEQRQFHLVADRVSDGGRLHQNYLGMKNSARLPATNHFTSKTYEFSVKLKRQSANSQAQPFSALRLIWHDYPGEWFEQDVNGPEEARRRVDTFRDLLVADVAVLLVDGQLLLENAGEEERYLKALLSNVGNNILTLKDDLLEEGKPLVEFPRIWILALSKADLLPDLDVIGFRDLVIEKAAGELGQLREILGSMVESSGALSVGEDFLLLSSAKFDAGAIDVTKRVGLDLILPIAAMLPLERHATWADRQALPARVMENLLRGAGPLREVLDGVVKRLPGPLAKVWRIVGPSVDSVTEWAADELRKAHTEALEKGDHLRATLTRFGLDLDDGEEARVLLRSVQ